MELFDVKGCLSEEGLQALVGGQLDETQRLEAAEHLAYCDRCMDRYTALLTDDVLEQPPRSARGAVMGTIWIRLMQNTWGRAAVATVAAVLALRVDSAEAQQIALDTVGGGEIVSQEVSSEGLWNEYSYEIINGDTWYDIEISGFGSVTELESVSSQYPRG